MRASWTRKRRIWHEKFIAANELPLKYQTSIVLFDRVESLLALKLSPFKSTCWGWNRASFWNSHAVIYYIISCHTLLPVAVVKIWCLSSLPWIHWTSSAQLDLWCASSRCSGTYFPVPASPGWKALKSHRSPLLDLGKSWDAPWELSTWKWIMNSEPDLKVDLHK